MKHEPKKYSLFCCACGDKFIAVRSDARSCSEGCRLALCMMGKVIKEQEKELSVEDKAKLEEATIKIKSEESNIIRRVPYRKDADDTIVIPEAVKNQLTQKELRPKKVKKEKEPKYDKKLITGKIGQEQEKLDKKEKKKAKKGGKE